MKVILIGFPKPTTAVCKDPLPDGLILLDSVEAMNFKTETHQGETIYIFISSDVGGGTSGDIRRKFSRTGGTVETGVSLCILKNKLRILISSRDAAKVVGRLTEDPNAGFRLADDQLHLVPNHPVLAGAYASGNHKPSWRITGGFPKRRNLKSQNPKKPAF